MRTALVAVVLALALSACTPWDNFTGPNTIGGPSISQIKAAVPHH